MGNISNWRERPAAFQPETTRKFPWNRWVISHLLQLSFSNPPLFLATISTQLRSPLVTLQKSPGKGAHGTWILPTSEAFKKVLYCLTSVSAFPSSMGLCPVTLSLWLAGLCALPSPGSDLPGATTDSSSLFPCPWLLSIWLSNALHPLQLLHFLTLPWIPLTSLQCLLGAAFLPSSCCLQILSFPLWALHSCKQMVAWTAQLRTWPLPTTQGMRKTLNGV